MSLATVIRKETTADFRAIAEVTVAAFKSLEVSSQTEQFIIEERTKGGADKGTLFSKRTKGHCLWGRSRKGGRGRDTDFPPSGWVQSSRS